MVRTHVKIWRLCHNAYYALQGRYISKKEGPRFVIFAQGRSGSTALRNLLDNHPRIQCEGELLMRRKFWAIDFIEGKAHSYNRLGKTWGFKLKWWHLTKYQNANVSEFLKRIHNNGWKIIYLKRKNIVYQALSTLSGEARTDASSTTRNKWRYAKEDEVTNPEIDVSKLQNYIESRKEQTITEKKALSDIPHHTVVYERNLADSSYHQKTLDSLCGFLGLTKCDANISFKKTGGGKVSKYARNAEQVTEKIEELGFDHYLRDSSYL